MDVDRSGLDAAPPGSYAHPTSTISCSACRSWKACTTLDSQSTFEHVKPLHVALENIRSHLRPGGTLLALFSGAFSLPSLANRVLRPRASRWVLRRVVGKDDQVFRAYYDSCWYSRLLTLCSGWSRFELVPLYRAAGYFEFSPTVLRTYPVYEDAIARGDRRNLATHCVLDARR